MARPGRDRKRFFGRELWQTVTAGVILLAISAGIPAGLHARRLHLASAPTTSPAASTSPPTAPPTLFPTTTRFTVTTQATTTSTAPLLTTIATTTQSVSLTALLPASELGPGTTLNSSGSGGGTENICGGAAPADTAAVYENLNEAGPILLYEFIAQYADKTYAEEAVDEDRLAVTDATACSVTSSSAVLSYVGNDEETVPSGCADSSETFATAAAGTNTTETIPGWFVEAECGSEVIGVQVLESGLTLANVSAILGQAVDDYDRS